MQIKIVFYKNSSKYYDSCCLKCESFEHYLSEKSINTVSIKDDEFREKRLTIDSLLSVIKHWSKSEYYIDDKKSSAEEIERIIKLLQCEKVKTEEVVGDHCYAINGWGCNSLEDISFSDEKSIYYRRHKYYWYEIGRFSGNEWIVDKDKIKRILSMEAERKHLTFCKCFDITRIEGEVDKLPDKIIVSDDEKCNWQYVYKEAAAGMDQTEIVGVEPRNRNHSSDGSFINIQGIYEQAVKEAEENERKNKNIPTVSFNDIGGMEDVIRQVREVIELPIVAPQIFEHYHLKPHKGILLYGPPGCGKTMVAKAIANEIKAHFIAVNGPEILNKFMGQSEENLRNIFNEAQFKKPSIIYFDEFDSISARRDSDDHLSSSTVVNQLLTLMDGMSEKEVCCIASTNRIDMIDEAIKRPGRFDYVIEIEKPSLNGCKAIFRIHTEKMPVDKSFDKMKFVEEYLNGLSGAEIAFVASEAAYNSIRRTIDMRDAFSGNTVKLTEDNKVIEMDFIHAVATLKERKKRADTAKFRYNI